MKSLPVFTISMRNSPRKTGMQSHWESFGIDLIFFDGIEGRKDLKNPTEFSEQLSDGEVGCFRSHLAIAQKIMQEKIPYALVLEDDVRVVNFPKLCVQIDWLVSLLPDLHWDYIRLYHGPVVPKTLLISKQVQGFDLSLSAQHKSSRSNAALLISQKGAEKFFKQAQRSDNFFKFEAVDRYLDNIQRSGVDLLISHLETLKTDETLETQTRINKSRRITQWQKLKNSMGRRWATFRMIQRYKKLIKKMG